MHTVICAAAHTVYSLQGLNYALLRTHEYMFLQNMRLRVCISCSKGLLNRESNHLKWIQVVYQP